MPGDLVECESRTLPDGSKGLVAVSLALLDPEDRSRRKVYGWCGAIVGGIIGLWAVIWLGFGGASLFVVPASCSMVFAWCSVRWGDDAWVVLSKLLS